jgi:predicted negative regulator of RcsB-dependent stress response
MNVLIQPEVFVASNLTRKEMKQDKFAIEVEHTVDYFAAHRQQTIRYGAIALAVLLIAGAVYYFRSSQHNVREQVLGEALSLTNAPVGSASPSGGPSFPTEAAKNDAVDKALSKVVSEYGGTEEGYMAEYYLGGRSADVGKMDDARKKYQDVADHASANIASLGKLSLAQIDSDENRSGDAEKLLKDLMDHPTDLVSKAQATIAYAKVIGPKRPDEARKLLTQIMSDKDQGDVSSIASAAYSDLPQK